MKLLRAGLFAVGLLVPARASCRAPEGTPRAEAPVLPTAPAGVTDVFDACCEGIGAAFIRTQCLATGKINLPVVQRAGDRGAVDDAL